MNCYTLKVFANELNLAKDAVLFTVSITELPIKTTTTTTTKQRELEMNGTCGDRNL